MRRSVSLSLGVAVVATVGLTMTPAFARPPSAPAHPSHGSSSTSQVRSSVVATGLDSPRHLTFGPDGHLYVAEAGTGGTADATGSNCAAVIDEQGQPATNCVGPTGAIARISGHHASVVLSGLASAEIPGSGEAAGPADVSFLHGSLFVVMQNTDVQPNGATGLPDAAELGKGVIAAQHSSRSSWALFPDFSAYASEHPQTAQGGTPGETAFDSDPYAVTPYRGGFAVADAAANDLLWISPSGRLSVLARFPSVPEALGPQTVQAQATPTSVTVGPDGALYVGELRGVPSAPGTAYVYRVVPGHGATVWAKGFSAITDLAFDTHGRLLVLEYSTNGLLGAAPGTGALVRIGSQHATPQTLKSGLTNPTGLAVSRGGDVYLSNNGTSAGTDATPGEVLELSGSGITGGSTHHRFHAPAWPGSGHGSWFSAISQWR